MIICSQVIYNTHLLKNLSILIVNSISQLETSFFPINFTFFSIYFYYALIILTTLYRIGSWNVFDKVSGSVSATLLKMYSLASTSQDLRSNLLLFIKFRGILGKFISQKNLVVAAFRCMVFKIFIPTKTGLFRTAQ